MEGRLHNCLYPFFNKILTSLLVLLLYIVPYQYISPYSIHKKSVWYINHIIIMKTRKIYTNIFTSIYNSEDILKYDTS